MGSDALPAKCKVDLSLQSTDRSERGYIRSLRRISLSDTANNNYGAGQQLVHQVVSQAWNHAE